VGACDLLLVRGGGGMGGPECGVADEWGTLGDAPL